VPRTKRIEAVFLNIPYDRAFEDLYLLAFFLRPGSGL
jgi:hypothetical protein